MNKYVPPLVLFLFLFAIAALFNFHAISGEKGIVLIPGEKPFRTNFTPFIAKNTKFQQGKSVEILSDALPRDGYYSLLYKFRTIKSGSYAVLLAGTPPGAEKPARSADWFSPYEIAVDGGVPFRLTNEAFKRTFPAHPKNTEYVRGGYHWSRVALIELSKGTHTIEIRVSEKRLRDGKYAFYLDTILLVPKDYKPKRVLKTLDPGLFA